MHGGPDLLELGQVGLGVDDVLDFSVNVNPYGAAPEMLRAIAAAPLDRYPDARAARPLAALAAAWEVDAAELAIGNGAAELLWTLVHTLCRADRPLVVVEPAFSEPRLAAAAAEIPVVTFRTRIEDGFALDPAALARAVADAGAVAVYLASPQNPAGCLVPPAIIAELAARLPAVTLLVDEAFLALSRGFAAAHRPRPANVVRVRSLTKEHALPGLRVGAVIGPPALIHRLEERRPAWTVSAPALAAAEAAAGLGRFVAGVRERWLADAAALGEDLALLGLNPRPTDTVFHLIEVGAAAQLRRRLLERHRILVRDCASFGLPRYIRLAGRPAEDRARLLQALRSERDP